MSKLDDISTYDFGSWESEPYLHCEKCGAFGKRSVDQTIRELIDLANSHTCNPENISSGKWAWFENDWATGQKVQK